MPTGTERATVNQITQIGLETTAGTAVAATKLIQGTDFQPGIKLNTKQFRAMGRKYPYLTVPGREWVDAKLAGPANYNELAYWLSCIGVMTPTTHTGGTNSKDWVLTPVTNGNANVQTYTVEKGDSIRAYKYAYGLLYTFNIHFTRDEVQFTGNMLGQRITDAITLTSSGIGNVTPQPILGSHVNWYLDTTSGGIGTTQLLNPVSGDLIWDAGYGTFWPMNRSNTSFKQHVDLAPKATLKMLLEADSAGMAQLSGARLGSTYYLQMDAQGPIIEGSIVYEWKVNFAAQVSNIQPFSDAQGVYAIEFEFTLVEDNTLAYAWKSTLTNNLAAL